MSEQMGVAKDGVPAHARTWAFFRLQVEGSSPALREFDKLPDAARAALNATMRRHAAGEARRKDVDHLGDGIYEIRTRLLNNQYRVLFFVWGPRLVVLTAFSKNQQATPQQDIERAKKRRKDWRVVFGHERDAG